MVNGDLMGIHMDFMVILMFQTINQHWSHFGISVSSQYGTQSLFFAVHSIEMAESCENPLVCSLNHVVSRKSPL
jgi:hypothetical protein